MNRSILRDMDSLGYEPDDVCRCLEALTPSDYCGRFTTTDGSGVEFDVYKPRFRHGPGIDHLYVKLSERTHATLPQVALASFHLTRIG